jgi:hypothetical protein
VSPCWKLWLAAAAICTSTGSVCPAQEAADAAQATAVAQSAKSSANPSKPKKTAKSKPVSKAREQELLAFVSQHHPELAALLEQLKPMQAKAYRAAIADLDRQVRRLEQIRKRSPAHYETELPIWIARSRIRLLAARLSISDDSELRDALRDELRELRQLEIAALGQQMATVRQNLEKQQRRLEKLQQRKRELESNDEEWLARQFSLLEQQNAKKKSPSKSTTNE